MAPKNQVRSPEIFYTGSRRPLVGFFEYALPMRIHRWQLATAAMPLVSILLLAGCSSAKSDDDYNLAACKKIAVELRANESAQVLFENLAKVGAATPTALGTRLVNVSTSYLDALKGVDNPPAAGLSVVKVCTDLGVDLGELGSSLG